ncbi:MAG: DNA polymerase III subunit epsilon [Pseudomonadota bacterium]
MREIVLDTETTGLSPKGGDRIVEIGCVELINHFPSGRTYHEYLNPERDMPVDAYKVHGLSGEFLSDKPLFKDLADGFLDFIEGAVLVIHNASFDVSFLNMELKRVVKPLISMDQVIDTLALARRKHPGAQNNLDALCRRYKIDNSSRQKHGALLDSEILAQVYAELIGSTQGHLSLSKEAQNTTEKTVKSYQAKQRENALSQRLTDEERAAHQSFLSEEFGDDAIWQKYMK